MYNNVGLMGRLIKDLEIKNYQGRSYYQFVLAHNKTKDDSFFITVTTNKLPDFMVKLLTKGTAVLVNGKLDIKKTKDGNFFTKIFAFEVTLLDHKPRGGNVVPNNNSNGSDNEAPQNLNDMPF